MGGLLKTLARLAFRRGTGAGSRQWLLLGAVTWLAGRARERAEAPPPVVHREVLGPGETISIAVYKPPRR
jgi:hypothetical protein